MKIQKMNLKINKMMFKKKYKLIINNFKKYIKIIHMIGEIISKVKINIIKNKIMINNLKNNHIKN